MTTKIVIDDVDYQFVRRMAFSDIDHDADAAIIIRPKRKQTGWQLPLRGGKRHIILTDETDDCWLRAGWSRFYGKVVEDEHGL